MEQNVVDFIGKCSAEVGKHAEFCFDIDIWNDCQKLNIDSPIEQILYCAIKMIEKLNYIESLKIFPQHCIGDYRVDFLIICETGDRIIVECDSQQFHDRTEKERRYEKTRDRFLQKEGYKVFRFTGSEIVSKALDVAIEIVAYLMGDANKKDYQRDANYYEE